MNFWDYRKSVDDLVKWQALPSEDKLFDKNLNKFIMALVTIKAHAWCMDVYAERKKMTQLIVEIVNELKIS